MRCMAEPCVRVSRFPARNLHYGFRYALGENVKLHLLPEMEFCYSSIYMYYTYVLLSEKDDQLYIGFTGDLKLRFLLHCQGKVPSTAPRRPLKLIFYEAYCNKYDALRRESYLKTSKGKTTLRTMLQDFLRSSLTSNRATPAPSDSLAE